MLAISHLTKYFSGFKAVDDLSFELRPGEIVGLLGPNGAGKTTTLRSICGILRPDGGSITAGGFDLYTQESEAKRLMAFVPETPNPYDLLTVREHIKFIAMCYNTVEIFDAAIEDLLARFDLKEKENELCVSLSKGMKQKLMIACAFVHRATIFLFDEPMMGLDPKSQFTLKSEMHRLRSEGAALLISTHQLDTTEKLCDRVLIMQHGKKLAEGSMQDLQHKAAMKSNSLEEVFLRLTEDQT
ncbi:MAG TPA: ABC transporter ATP-binding protein [Bacteroidota bacterium]|nr:ABC transporter ATP-binding protein [Bacteroidota bacterium]